MDRKPDSRQKNELRVLSSIYPCLEDLTNGNKKKPMDIRIKLEPFKSCGCNETLVTVHLHVICSLLYPKELPIISLEKSIGLTSENLKQLRQELFEITLRKRGHESIFDLCQYVQLFLYNQNNELLIQRQIEEEKKLQEKQEMDRRARESDEELSRIIKAQKPENVVSSLSPVGRSNSSEESNRVCSHDSICNISIGSMQIITGNCSEHFGPNHSVHNGIDKENGKTFTVHEWKLINLKNNSEEILEQIKAIEEEFNCSIKSLKHENLASYYNISWNRHEDGYIIQTVEEQLKSPNCNTSFIKCKIKLDIQYIRNIAKSVLEVLDFLHSRNVVHGDIGSSCIHIEEGGIVKVARYATHRRLSLLVENKPLVNYNKRNDIQKYGKFILEIVTGPSMPDGEQINIPPDLCEFLKMCEDEDQQCTTAELLKHKFLNQNSLGFGQGDDELEYFENNDNFEMQKRNLPSDTSTSFDQCRISSNFEEIEFLGKGGFGSVHKYKNNIDERFYAIKKIQLSTRSEHTIERIKNEVKLLSRLNHENVVRYFTSWMEEVEVDDRSSSCDSVFSSEKEEKVKYIRRPDELALMNKLSTYSHLQSQSFSDSDSSDEDEDDNYSEKSESGDIIFLNPENEASANKDIVEAQGTSERKSFDLKRTYMYIQMEFCENSTLRSAIDDDSLCGDDSRVERHFREILEGLEYIHKQGMIHRDLKPANIFFDLNDQVKIGDFGLATSNIKWNSKEEFTRKSELDSLKEKNRSKTVNVGTWFYVAPELANANAKVDYDGKVDIYSLGIILFEMCYKPFPTGMERNSVLLALRQKDVKFPEDHESTLVKKYSTIIRWLLEHDVSKRPTVEDILESKLAPPPVFKKTNRVMNHIIANPQTKVYKSLVDKLFKQKFPLDTDLQYDYEESSTSFRKNMDTNYDLVNTIAVKVFTNHGAKNMSTPFFMPFSNNNTFQKKEMCVKLMTHGGNIVSIPCDLRVHFARYVAWNSLYLVKRYSIERVFHEQKVFGVSPKSVYECAFDIVTPTAGKHLLPDGEILHAVFEILRELSVFDNKNVVIYLNHALLLKAIMIYFRVDKKYHFKILEIFHGHQIKNNNLRNKLANLNLTSSQIDNLTGIFFSKSTPGEMPPIVKTIKTGKVKKSKKLALRAERELTKLINIAREMGVEFDICIEPGLIHNVQQFSGMICKFFYKKSHRRMVTLAAGGRYDSMITHYRNLLKGTHLKKHALQSAVGISLFLDKIVAVLQKLQAPGSISRKFFDVLVCLENEWPPHLLVEVLKNLSSLQIEWILFQTNSRKKADKYGEDLHIPHIVMLLNDYNENKIVLKSWNDDRSICWEKQCNITELVKELNRVIEKRSVPSKKHLGNQIKFKLELDDISELFAMDQHFFLLESSNRD